MAAATAFSAGAISLAQALDLGDLEKSPTLGQPLRLDFPLRLAPGESIDGLQVSVRARPALAAEADAAWMQSPFRIILTDHNGRPGIRICNEQALDEPMLELHLALRSAAGAVSRRRYDVLGNPPLAGASASACEPLNAVAAVAATPRNRQARPAETRDAPRRAPRPARSGNDAVVLPGDTLSELAQQLRGDHAIALRVMVSALYRANPEAFIDSPDRLRAGSYLSIPDLAALSSGAIPSAKQTSAVASATTAASTDTAASGLGETWPAGGPADWVRRLTLSYRLSILPSAAEQRLVSDRYQAAAAPVEPPAASAPPSRASVALPLPSTPARGFELPWLGIAFTLALFALYLVLRRAWAPGRRPAPTAAEFAPDPEEIEAIAVVERALARPRPARVRSRHQEAAEEVVGRDFYDEVAVLLSGELRKNPERRDLRFRLLDLYFTAGKRDAFVEHTQDYLRSLRGTPDENWPEIVRMGLQIAPESGLFSNQAGDLSRANVIPLPGARTAARRFYENADPAALRDLRENLDRSYRELRRDNTFWRDLAGLAQNWVSPDPGLLPAERLTQYLGGARILFRDERRRAADECAALVAIGQVLMARRLGYRRVVAGGMRSRHALMVAYTAKRLGLDYVLHLSSTEQAQNAGALERVAGPHLQMRTVPETDAGTVGNAQLQALHDGLSSHESLYISPAAAGPPPYPTIVVDIASLLGRNLRAQMVESIGRVADVLITHGGDGLHTIGLMETFLESTDTQLLCMESATPANGGLLFPREHRLLRTTGRVGYQRIAEDTARFITQFCAERQYAELGLAGSEVFAAALRVARDLPAGKTVVAVLPSEGVADAAVQAPGQGLRAVEKLQGIPPPSRA